MPVMAGLQDGRAAGKRCCQREGGRGAGNCVKALGERKRNIGEVERTNADEHRQRIEVNASPAPHNRLRHKCWTPGEPKARREVVLIGLIGLARPPEE